MRQLRKFGLITALALATLAASATISDARGGFSGGGRSGGFGGGRSSFSSRSYSAPRTVYRSNTTVEHHYYGGGSGFGGSGFLWGYMLGHDSTPAPAAAPSVVVVPGAVPTSGAQVSPNASTVAPIAQPQVIQQEPEDDTDGAGWGFLVFLILMLVVAAIVYGAKREKFA